MYHWLFSECFPLLLGDDVVCSIKVILTDGDSDAYTPLCCLIDDPTTPWHGCYHGLCAWHLFDNSWLKHITPSVPKIRNKTTIEYLEVAKKWIKSWFWSIATKQQYEISKAKFFTWLNTSQVNSVFGNCLCNSLTFLVKNILEPVAPKWVRYVRFSIPGSMEERTTSIVEQINGSLKRSSGKVHCNMSIDEALRVAHNKSEQSFGSKMKKSGLALSSAPLWTNLTDAIHLTSHAAGLVSVNFNRRVKYVSARISQTQWYVLARDHVTVLCSGLEEDGCDGPIPKWKPINTLTLLNDKFLHCSCQYYCRVGLPCAHLLSVINDFSISMAMVKWWKVYHYYGLHNTEITHQLNLFQSDLDAENISFAMENKENNDEGSTVQSVTTKNSRCQLLSQCHLTVAVQNARATQQPVSLSQVPLSYRDTFSCFSECYKVVENNPIIHAKLNEKLDEIHSFLVREVVNNQQGQGGGQSPGIQATFRV